MPLIRLLHSEIYNSTNTNEIILTIKATGLSLHVQVIGSRIALHILSVRQYSNSRVLYVVVPDPEALRTRTAIAVAFFAIPTSVPFYSNVWQTPPLAGVT